VLVVAGMKPMLSSRLLGFVNMVSSVNLYAYESCCKL